MPNFHKRKLSGQNEAETMQDLCRIARRQMVFFELCPSDDWTRDALNEVSSTLPKKIVGALTKLTQQQDEPKAQQTELSNGISNLNLTHSQNKRATRDPTKLFNREVSTGFDYRLFCRSEIQDAPWFPFGTNSLIQFIVLLGIL